MRSILGKTASFLPALRAQVSSKARVLSWFLRTGTRKVKAPFRNIFFRSRVARRRRFPSSTTAHPAEVKITALSDMLVSFISLESRNDRRSELLPEFSRMGLAHATHFVALRRENGALGCAESHQAVLEQFGQSERLLMVCEDDISFRISAEELLVVVQRFAEDPLLDVLQLDIRTRSKLHDHNELFKLTNNSNLTGCYVVKPYAVRVLRGYFRESVLRLRKGQPDRRAAIDVVWTKAQQRKLVFATPAQRVVIQKSGHSDIVGRYMKLDT